MQSYFHMQFKLEAAQITATAAAEKEEDKQELPDAWLEEEGGGEKEKSARETERERMRDSAARGRDGKEMYKIQNKGVDMFRNKNY